MTRSSTGKSSSKAVKDAPKKSAAKKAAPKKAVTKKALPKKVAAKKSPAKSTVNKPATKKVAPKKTTAKKAPSKKVAAKTANKVTAESIGKVSVKRPANLGVVSLVAAGPGAPELVTQRARTLLEAAEVVISDVDAQGLQAIYAPQAELVLMVDESEEPIELDGQAKAKRTVELAREGKNVVRLLAGDPTLDGAFSIETAVLHRSKIPFELAPGVAIATGLSAYGAFPLTKGAAGEVRVVSIEDIEQWDDFASSQFTLVIRDGAERAVEIAKSLIAAGRKPETPIAVTRGSTTVEQRTLVSTLAELAPIIKASKQTGQGTVVVGEVLNSVPKMSWFETKPLFGWRVLVPRTKEQSSEVCDMLREYGAVPIEVPTISVEPPRTPQQMDRAIQGLVSGRYQWIGFTSANAVRAIREKFEAYGLDARALAGLKIAAVGDATVAALVAFGVKPDLIPQGEQSTAELLAEWAPYDAEIDPIDRVFLPRADISTEQLTAGLQKIGWEVDDIVAYRTVRAAPPPADTREAIKTGGFDAVLFTSSSTVRNLVGIAGKPHACTVVAAIGPATAQTVGEHGLRVDVRPDEPTMQLLVDSLAEHGEALRRASIANGEFTWRPSLKRAGSRRRKKAKAIQP